jgi:hypothetical protein
MPKDIFIIGDGRHAFDYFRGKLRQYEIEFLCDVRSVATNDK